MPAAGYPLSRWINEHQWHTSLPTLSDMEMRKQPQQNPNNIHFILLFSHQLSHFISIHPVQKSTGAVGNPEGFLLQVFSRLWQLTQGKQSREEPAGYDLLTPMSHSQFVFSVYLGLPTSCPYRGVGKHCSCCPGTASAACKAWWRLRDGRLEAAKNNCHPKGPCLLLLFQFWGALLESPHS